jgi:myosin-crossreactive antigen
MPITKAAPVNIKAFFKLTNPGGTGAIVPDRSFNIASVTQSVTNTFDVVFSSAMATANYQVIITGEAITPTSVFTVQTGKTSSGFTAKLTGGTAANITCTCIE